MKYLLTQCFDYKGGELASPVIRDSVIECLDYIHDDIGETFEEFKEMMRNVILNRSEYAGGGDHCFNINPISKNDLTIGETLLNTEMLDEIDKFTKSDYKKLIERYV